jgi:hypothetical protein
MGWTGLDLGADQDEDVHGLLRAAWRIAYREVKSREMLDEVLMRMAISMEGYLKKIAAIECLKEARPMLSQRQTIDRVVPLLEKVHNELTWRGDVQRRMDQLRLS